MIRQVLKINRLNLQYDILYVVNPVKGRTRGLTVVNVRMDSAESSKKIRDLYSGFFGRNQRVQLPGSLKGVSVRNRVTLDTRIRIAILQQLGVNYKNSNPGATVKVRGYDPRPVLVTVPPRSASSSERTNTFTFMEAVKKLPAIFSDESLGRIFQVIRGHHQGTLRKYFVIISDDDRARCESLVPNRAVTAAVTTSGQVSGPSSGMDLQAGFLASLRSPPPPPPPLPAPLATSTRFRSSSRSISPASRGLKRNQLSPPAKRKNKRSRRASSSSSSGSSRSPPRRTKPRSSSSGSSQSSSTPPRRTKHQSKGKRKSKRR